VESPVLQALVLADYVYQDAKTGKKVIAGTFNRLTSLQFPCVFSRPTWAYVCLTGIRDKTPLSLQYVDLQDNRVLMKFDLQVEADDPLRSIELIFEVPQFPMPHEGVYAFEILHDGTQLGSVRILVDRAQEQEGNGE